MFPKKTLLVGLVLLLGCAGSQEAAPDVIATNVEKSAMAIENRKHRAQEAAEAWQDLVEDLGSNDGLVELPELKQSLNIILQKDPTHLQARYNRGRLAKQAGDVFAWRQDFKLLAQHHPRFYPGIVGGVEAFVGQKKPFEAIALLQRFVEEQPTHLPARLQLAHLHWEQKDTQSAFEQAQKILKNSPVDAREDIQFDAHVLAIRCQLKAKRLAPARLILERVAQLWPKQSDLHGLRAELDAAEGNVGGGLKGLEAAVKEDPTQTKLRIRLINGFLEHGDFHRAIPHLLALEESAPNKAPIQRLLGKAYQGAGQFADAARAHRRLFKEFPNDSETLWNHAQLLELHLGSYPRAIEFYQKLRALKPDWPGLGDALDRVVQLERVAQATIEAERTKKALRGQVLEICASSVGGQAPDFGVVGEMSLLKEFAWEMMEEAQKEGVNGNSDTAAGQVRCAKEMIRAVGDPNGEQCASMVVLWGQVLLEIGRWEEALEAIWGAQECLKSGQSQPSSGAFADVKTLENQLQNMLGPDVVKALKDRLDPRSKPVDL